TPGGPNAIPLSGSGIASAYSTQPMSAEERGRALAESAFSKSYLAAHPEIIQSMIESRRQRPIDTTGFAHRMKAAREHNTYDRLGQIRCPTLVITGKDDALISWENSRILSEKIAGAQFVLLEPAGHCFWMEKPQESHDAIAKFIAGHRS
ncbi:MAG TPA: alpha/beta hydrolase, partial [Candidatus Binataceae bacterium]|nr:alpha/beta hydrolase [Candidatus Binataceae bacterium]